MITKYRQSSEWFNISWIQNKNIKEIKEILKNWLSVSIRMRIISIAKTEKILWLKIFGKNWSNFLIYPCFTSLTDMLRLIINKQQVKIFTGIWTWLVTESNTVKPEGLFRRLYHVWINKLNPLSQNIFSQCRN